MRTINEPTHFPLFDFFVERLLLHYQKQHSFANFRKTELKDYKRFIEIIEAFQNFYGFDSFSRRDIDIYLWLEGKKMFKRTYY